MASNITSTTLTTVKDLILDEQKLVTYTSLSKDLCIHVNEAKALLNRVVDEIKEKNANVNLNISFIISGLTSSNSGRTVVCSEKCLEAELKKFITVFFRHIYSVSKGSSLLDSAVFTSVNKFEDFPLCAGLIRGNYCSKRSFDEIGKLKSNIQVVDQKAIFPKTESKDKTKLQNGHKDVTVSIQKTKSEPVVKAEIISPKKNSSSIANVKSTSRNSVKSSKGISGFFTKSNSAPTTKETKLNKELNKETGVKTDAPEVKIKSEPKTVKDIEVEVEIMDIEEETPAKKIKRESESTKKSKSKNSSLSQIKKNAKVDKKRKRVLHVSESESDDDPFADEKPVNDESEDEIPPTPTTNHVKITSGILNPKKKRKMVDKTYTDEDGYILTRKEEVYESCSEDEVEPDKPEPVPVKQEKENVERTNKVKTEISPKEKKPKNTKKKVSPPQKGKQATLTSFFKKV